MTQPAESTNNESVSHSKAASSIGDAQVGNAQIADAQTTDSKTATDAPEKATQAGRAAQAAKPAEASEPAVEVVAHDTFLYMIVALILAFIFRAYLVEPFVIPSGSMNPTLKGTHLTLNCPDCGYRFHSDVPTEDRYYEANNSDGYTQTYISQRVTSPLIAPCPMCSYPQPIQDRLMAPGDRILVHKLAYAINPPKRWDVVVFKNPQSVSDDGQPGPKTNYIKRVAGLPNETLLLIDGDVYTSHDGVNYQIARKTDAKANPRWEKIQRELWEPIYHSRYMPRGLPRESAVGPQLTEQGLMFKPTESGRIQAAEWIDPWRSDEGHWSRSRLGYLFDPDLDDEDASSKGVTGTLAFRWGLRPNQSQALAPYNQLTSQGTHDDPIEDVRLSLILTPESDLPTGVTLRTTSRLNDTLGRQYEMAWIIDPSGAMMLKQTRLDVDELDHSSDVAHDDENQHVATKPENKTKVLLTHQGKPIESNRPMQLELWLVDQSALLWQNGQLVARYDWPTSASIDAWVKRKSASNRPQVHVDIHGGPALIQELNLDRDLYYQAKSTLDDSPLRGALAWNKQQTKPVALEADEYFCMGDNPARSGDSRIWFETDPFLLSRYYNREDAAGVVAGELILGRAFWVYFPAPLPWNEQDSDKRVIPNTGDVRMIH